MTFKLHLIHIMSEGKINATKLEKKRFILVAWVVEINATTSIFFVKFKNHHCRTRKLNEHLFHSTIFFILPIETIINLKTFYRSFD
jgi:hypothetical protein